ATLLPGFAGKNVKIEGTVYYQACNNETCLAPAEAAFSSEIQVAAPGEKVARINADIFNLSQSQPPAKLEEKSSLATVIESKGMFVAFLVIFVSGLALNLTPCVYPLIPITISYFGGQVGGKKSGLFLHGIIYVLGMALTYSVLGVIAALTGSILGAWLQNPVVLLFIAAIMVLLALSMFGMYEIRVPTKLSNFAGQSKQGIFGTFFMGLTVGIIAAPCIGPFVLALLTYVGEKGDPVLGFSMFFVLSMGLGLPFIFLALFSGMINRIPRSGAWMEWVRKIFGFILLGVALYFLNPLFSNELWYYSLLAITFLFGGIYMAWIEPTTSQGKVFPVIRNLIGIVFMLVGVFFLVTSMEAHVDNKLREFKESFKGSGEIVTNEVNWLLYSEQNLARAREENKPVMIDFYADWCIPCKELDKFTFSSPEVIETSRNFFMLKADLTQSGSSEVKALMESYNIKGVPTLVFLSPRGEEIPGTRVVGFLKAEEFLQIMQKALLPD
ncbi:MAG: protein-disulfide reductase DsbD family protein, partial [Calditrichia bacterium]